MPSCGCLAVSRVARRAHRLPARHRAGPRRRLRPDARSRLRWRRSRASTTSSATSVWCSPRWDWSRSPCQLAAHRELGVAAPLPRVRRERGNAGRQPRSSSAPCWAPSPQPRAARRCGGLRLARARGPGRRRRLVLAGLACFIAIGVALGSLMPTGRSANALGNLIFIPMFLLGGGGPPREVMTGRCRRSPMPCRSAMSSAGSAWPGSAPPTIPTRSGGPCWWLV